MGFRDDREALAAKVAALEGENARLRERLENALEELDDGTDQAAMLRAELKRARAAATHRIERQSPSTPPATRPSPGESGFLANSVVGLIILFVIAALVISHFTRDDIAMFLLYMCGFVIAVLLAIGALIWRAVQSFAKDWKL